MFCRGCGTDVHAEDRFCVKCGAAHVLGPPLFSQSSSTTDQVSSAAVVPTRGGRFRSYIKDSGVSNTVVWWLAFAPVLGSFASGFLAALFHIGIWHFWWITLALNIGLSMADEKNLREAGFETSKLGQAWLVPVYLYKRAELLEQGNTYFMVWTILFVLSIFGVL